jgi:hypothetical protein
VHISSLQYPLFPGSPHANQLHSMADGFKTLSSEFGDKIVDNSGGSKSLK